MNFSSLSWSLRWRQCRFAFLAVAVATGCVGLLMLLIALPVFVIYIAAIAVSTHYGGISTGLVAAVFAFFASTFLFIPPYFSLMNEPSVLPLLLFYYSAVALSGLMTCICLRWKGERKQGPYSKRPMRSNDSRMNGSRHPHRKH
jgi:K+-sensing histidine kinase KdpD